MKGDLSNQLFPGILTLIIPVLMLVAVFVYSRRQRQKVKRELEQTRHQDPNLRDWARMEEEIKPSRQWYSLPVLVLVVGWTIGVGSINHLHTATALGLAAISSIAAILIAAVISRQRAAARKLLLNTPAYQQYGHQHLGLAWFIKMFVIASLIGLVAGFLRSPGGLRWIKERFGGQTMEETGASSQPAASPGTHDRQAQLPTDFPADIPVYPGATVDLASTAGGVFNVTLTVSDSVERVARFYMEELKKNGWRIDDKHTSKDLSRIDATKAQHRCSVRLTETEATHTRIIIVS